MKNIKKLISKDDLIFIAGHKGMVGKSIFKELKNKGYKNLITVSKKDLDLRSKSKVADWFKENKPNVVVIAAAKVGGIEANKNYPTEFLLDNLIIQNNVIESAWRNNTKRLLFLGSSCIYPKFAKQPITEEELLTSSLEKTNESYAIAKIAGLQLCKSLRYQYGFDAISLMPTNLYGPGDNFDLSNGHVLAALIKKFCDAKSKSDLEVKCWGSGKPFREFLHVNDLAKACIFCLENWNPKDSQSPRDENNNPLTFLNVGTGKDISIKELAILIAEITDYSGEIIWDKTKPDGTPKKLLDISRINNLGWEAKISLREGLESTIEHYKNSNQNTHAF